MNTDKIREAIQAIKWEGCSPGGYYDRFDIPQKAIDEIMRVITPYLAHGITEKEAQIIGARMHTHSLGEEKERAKNVEEEKKRYEQKK